MSAACYGTNYRNWERTGSERELAQESARARLPGCGIARCPPSDFDTDEFIGVALAPNHADHVVNVHALLRTAHARTHGVEGASAHVFG